MNLLEETKDDIRKSGHIIADIMFIGSVKSGHSCSWKEYQKLANQEYDAGFGAQEVAEDLVIIFKDGASMWRHDYDGAERWDYSVPLKLPEAIHQIKSLFVRPENVGWQSLREINEEKS